MPTRARHAVVVVVGAAMCFLAGTSSLAPWAGANVGSGTRAVFVPITPCRLLDTRPAPDNVGPRTAPLAAGETFTQQVSGANGRCTIPAGIASVAMNVTAVNPTAPGFLTLWPADAGRPLASNLNWVPGSPPTPNKVDVKLSAGGAVSMFTNLGTVDVVADVVGYYDTHDHDDRYYTKGQLAPLLGPQVVSIPPDALVLPAGGTLNGDGACTFNSAPTNLLTGRVPITLPLGAQILKVSLMVHDTSSLDTYALDLHRVIVDNGSLVNLPVSGASSSGGGGNDEYLPFELVPSSPEYVLPHRSYYIAMTQMRSNNNAFCGAMVTYQPNATAFTPP